MKILKSCVKFLKSCVKVWISKIMCEILMKSRNLDMSGPVQWLSVCALDIGLPSSGCPGGQVLVSTTCF